MLEDIRRKIMTRQVDMIKFDNTLSDITSMARLTLEDNKEIARRCKVLWNADVGFEIGDGEYRHTVNLSDKCYSCRIWQLRGIPCQHAICSYYHIEQEPEHFVEYWYRKDTYLKTHSHFIQPIPNMKMWPETNNPKIEPCTRKSMPDRPKKKRTKAKDELKKKYGKVSRKGGKIICSKCHQQGHNKRYCKVVPSAEIPSQSSRQPAPRSSSQPSTKKSKQPTTSSSQPTLSTSICDDTTRVRRMNENRK